MDESEDTSINPRELNQRILSIKPSTYSNRETGTAASITSIFWGGIPLPTIILLSTLASSTPLSFHRAPVWRPNSAWQ